MFNQMRRDISDSERPAKRPKPSGEGIDDLPDKEGAKAYLTATFGAARAGQTLARLERDFDYTREQREQVRRQRENYNRSVPGRKRERELIDTTTGMTSTKKRIGAVLSNDDFAAQDFARQRQAIRQNAQQLAAQHDTVTTDRQGHIDEMTRIVLDGRRKHGAAFPWPGFSASNTQNVAGTQNAAERVFSERRAQENAAVPRTRVLRPLRFELG